uniref:Uncharacterized protein n=1 Tax=Kalanchoe fedtschenkoi TaxID=63787 RepID=A0A7N0U1E8_KALFE
MSTHSLMFSPVDRVSSPDIPSDGLLSPAATSPMDLKRHRPHMPGRRGSAGLRDVEKARLCDHVQRTMAPSSVVLLKWSSRRKRVDGGSAGR